MSYEHCLSAVARLIGLVLWRMSKSNVDNPPKPRRRRADVKIIKKLAALVPPPRINQVRYHGLFAPNAKDRDKVVPAEKATVNEHGADDKGAASRKYRLSWAALITRVFLADVETCPQCGGKMRTVAVIAPHVLPVIGPESPQEVL